jgi:molybdopterin-guanine dinucleotide biosynthesis protein A
MGEDKGTLVYHGVTQVEYCVRLLEPYCRDVCVSVRREQAALEPYVRFACVPDPPGVQGPAAGLLAAWGRYPGSDLLVLAVDLPCVDAATLEYLLKNRDRTKAATAFRHPDGITEPLIAIWEASAARPLERAARGGSASLRRLLDMLEAKLLEAPDPDRLINVNTPAALRATKKALDAS